MADKKDVNKVSMLLGIGSDNQPAAFLRDKIRQDEKNRQDPAREMQGMPPNFGQDMIPHILTFQGMVGSYSKVYRASDEAIKKSLDESRFMRNDPVIMECVESRQRATALLDWHLEAENDRSQDQKELCRQITNIVERIRRFTEYRFCLGHATWYGRYGIQHAWGWKNIGGQMRVMPRPVGQEHYGWLPINGDKLVFRYDDGNYDGERPPNQVGIRVGARTGNNDRILDPRWSQRIEPTDRGPAYFLTDYEREMIAIHKHMIEDGAYEDGLDAGTVHGVGIRSRIYWAWFQKQEMLAFLVEYLERSAGGIEIWRYPWGNSDALDKMQTAAKERISNQHRIVFVPTMPGEDALNYGVDHVEPGMAGIEALNELLQKYWGHQIKRYILGQTLSSEADATGLGSGLAELHLDTLLQIIRYDATNLEETITEELIRRIKEWNFPKARDIHIKFKIDTETADLEKKLEAWMKAYEMGCQLKERDVMDLVGASMPEAGDRVLQNPAFTGMPGEPTGAGGQPNNKTFSFPGRGQHIQELSSLLGVGDPDANDENADIDGGEGGKDQKADGDFPRGDKGERKKMGASMKLRRFGFTKPMRVR